MRLLRRRQCGALDGGSSVDPCAEAVHDRRLLLVRCQLVVSWRVWSAGQFGSRRPGVCGKSPEVELLPCPGGRGVFMGGAAVPRRLLRCPHGTAGGGRVGTAVRRWGPRGMLPTARRTARDSHGSGPVGPARAFVGFPVLRGRVWGEESPEPRYFNYLGSGLFLCPAGVTWR